LVHVVDTEEEEHWNNASAAIKLYWIRLSSYRISHRRRKSRFAERPCKWSGSLAFPTLSQ